MPRRHRRARHLVSYNKCEHPGPWRAVTKTADNLHAYGICQACEGRAQMTQDQIDDYDGNRADHEPPMPEWQRIVQARKAKP